MFVSWANLTLKVPQIGTPALQKLGSVSTSYTQQSDSIASSASSSSKNCLSSLIDTIKEGLYSFWTWLKSWFCSGASTPSLTVEEHLDQIFASKTRAQKVLMVDGSKVGVIFDPEGEALNAAGVSVRDFVVLISDQKLPELVERRINAKIPATYTYSVIVMNRVNGRTPFQAFGLE